MHLQVELTGTSPLVMHNIRLANPRDPYVRAIKELTGKPARNKTQDDADEIDRLEFFGSLYHDEQYGIHIPTWNIKRSFENGGKLTKQGTALMRSVEMTDIAADLVYPGPKSPAALWKDETFRWSTLVGVQRAKTTRMRPIFRQWSLAVDLELLTDVLDRDAFDRIVSIAGRVEGVGDARKLGYGRYDTKVIG